jgi:hypothetical protein
MPLFPCFGWSFAVGKTPNLKIGMDDNFKVKEFIMKKFSKLFGAMLRMAIIALVAVIGFSMAACKGGDDDDPPPYYQPTPDSTPTYSIEGTWEVSGGWAQVTVTGSTGVWSSFGSLNALFTSAKNQGYIGIGTTAWRYISSTGSSTYSGQQVAVTYNTSSPNVATGTKYNDCTFTLSSNGQTLTITGTDSSGTTTQTWTRVTTYSINGVWLRTNGTKVTVSGSTGTTNAFGEANVIGQDAINKKYWNIGDPYWRNITSTGSSTWSGQQLMFTYNTSSPNVATGTTWRDSTFTLSSNGQTLTVKNSDTSTSYTDTWTRQ